MNIKLKFVYTFIHKGSTYIEDFIDEDICEVVPITRFNPKTRHTMPIAIPVSYLDSKADIEGKVKKWLEVFMPECRLIRVVGKKTYDNVLSNKVKKYKDLTPLRNHYNLINNE